jgi:hypothetical protein
MFYFWINSGLRGGARSLRCGHDFPNCLPEDGSRCKNRGICLPHSQDNRVAFHQQQIVRSWMLVMIPGEFFLGVSPVSSAGRGAGARLPPCGRLYWTVAEKPTTMILLLHRSLSGEWCLHLTDKLLLRTLGEPMCRSCDPVFLVGSLSSPPQVHTLLLLPFLEHHISVSDYMSGPWKSSVRFLFLIVLTIGSAVIFLQPVEGAS